jgi:dihydroxy-acid dehydratase
MGVDLAIRDWDTIGYDIPLLVNLMPAGQYLGEEFHRAGGVPAVMHELLKAGKLRPEALNVSGRTIGECYRDTATSNTDVIRAYDKPLLPQAGFAVLSGNLFDSAVMKTSVISPEFRQRYLEQPGDEGAFEGRAIVFEGPEDYHAVRLIHRGRCLDPSEPVVHDVGGSTSAARWVALAEVSTLPLVSTAQLALSAVGVLAG